MTDTLYRIITCTRDEGCDWERSSEVVAICDAEAEAAWDAAVAALRPRPYEQCVTLADNDRAPGRRIIRRYTEDAIDVVPAAIAKLRGEVVADVVVYFDDAAQAWYAVDLCDVRDLGERLLDDPDAYSRWCAETTPLGEGETREAALVAAEVEP